MRKKASERKVSRPRPVAHSQGMPNAPILVVTPSHDSPGRHDFSGAFDPEARAFSRMYVCERRYIDNTQPQLKRMKEYVLQLEALKPRTLVQLSHGYKHGTQLGPRSPGHPAFRFAGNHDWWERMVNALATHIDPVVVLYACSTGDDPEDDPDSAPGSGDGSYADELRDALCRAGATRCRVIAHTTAGHCTQNPHVKAFDGLGSPLGGVGAMPLCPRGYEGAWARMLRTDARFRFPFLPVAELHALIAAAAKAP